MTDQPTGDFDGCNSECRKAGKHSLRWGGCEHATPPEPSVSMSVVYTDPTDGYPAIGFDTYTVPQLAELIEPALRTIKISLGPNARALLESGHTVGLSAGEYASLALAAADAIVHRHEEERPVVPVSSPPPDQTALHDRIAEALDSLKGTMHHLAPKTQQAVQEAVMAALAAAQSPDQALAERIAAAAIRLGHPRWDADDLAAAVLAVLPPPADRAAVLLWAADQIDAETRQLKADEVLEPEKFRPCRDASEQLRRLAAEAQQPDTAHSCSNCEGVDPDSCPMNPSRPDVPPSPAHIGGNADDCPACQAQGLHTIGHPYECPGPETTAGSEEAGRG